MELFLNNDINSYFLTLLYKYSHLNESKRVKIVELSPQTQKLIQEGIIKLPAIPSLVTEDGQILLNVLSIAQYLCELSYTELILMGDSNQYFGQITQVFEAQRKLTAIELVDMFTQILEHKVYLVSNHVTIADLFLFCHTYDVVAKFTDEDKNGKYIHYFRWFKLIQNLPQIKEINQELGRVQIQPPSPFTIQQSGKGQKKQKK